MDFSELKIMSKQFQSYLFLIHKFSWFLNEILWNWRDIKAADYLDSFVCRCMLYVMYVTVVELPKCAMQYAYQILHTSQFNPFILYVDKFWLQLDISAFSYVTILILDLFSCRMCGKWCFLELLLKCQSMWRRRRWLRQW